MMPPLLAPPTNVPVAPASPDNGPPAREHDDQVSGSPDFATLLATLAGPVPPRPSPAADASGESQDGLTDADAGPKTSPETQLSAVTDQAGGLPAGLCVARLPGDGNGPDQAIPAVSGTIPGAARSAAADESRPGPQASPAPLRPLSESLPPAAPASDPLNEPAPLGVSTASDGAAPRPTEPTVLHPAPVADAASRPRPGSSIADPSPSAQPARPGSAVAALAHSGDGDGPGSAVAALAHSGDGDGSGSAVAALAHSGDGGVPGSAVAALAHSGDGDRPGSAVAALAHSADGVPPVPSDRAGLRPGAARPFARAERQPTGAVLEADPVLTVGAAVADAPAAASPEAGSVPSRRPSGATGELSVVGPQAAGNPSARPAEAVATPSSTAPVATPPAMAEQIVSAVVPLHGRGDGRHVVTLELRPEDLGAIRVEVAVEHQTVHVTLHAVEPATGRLLSAALPELRSALTDAGLTAGHVGVGPGGGGGAGQRRSATGDGAPVRGRAGAGPTGGPDSTGPARTSRPAAAGRLDLFL